MCIYVHVHICTYVYNFLTADSHVLKYTFFTAGKTKPVFYRKAASLLNRATEHFHEERIRPNSSELPKSYHKTSFNLKLRPLFCGMPFNHTHKKKSFF